MKKFGVIKSKLLNKLTESYANENKAEIKNILTTIKENKKSGEFLVSFLKRFRSKGEKKR